MARWGVAKTTIDDIAREAGCSRATVYRAFPGGKQAVLQATGETEVARLMATIADQLDATGTLDELLVVALSCAAGEVRDHEALQYLLVHEPGHVLTHLAFDALDPLLELARAFGRPYLERHLEPDAAGWTAEWVTRLIVSYSIEAVGTDLTDDAVARRIVETHLMPGLRPHLVAGVTEPTIDLSTDSPSCTDSRPPAGATRTHPVPA
jgi:AcrR family transcriptional regulator